MQLGQRVVGVLALHGQQDDGVLVPRDLRRMEDGRDGQRHRLTRRFQDEAGLQGASVLAPGHQGDVEAALEQPGADGASDGTGPEDDEAHGVHSVTCQAFCVASLNPVERATARWRAHRCASSVDWPPRPAATWPVRCGAPSASGRSGRRSPATLTRPFFHRAAWRGGSTPTCPSC